MTHSMVAAGPGIGWFPDTQDIYAYNRTGSVVVKGDVEQLDLVASIATETTTYLPGPATSVFSNMVPPSAAAAADAWPSIAVYGVCLDDTIADDAVGKWRLRGICQAMVKRTGGSGTVTEGAPLTITTAEDLDAIPTATAGVQNRIVALLLQADTTIDTRALQQVLFEGINWRMAALAFD